MSMTIQEQIKYMQEQVDWYQGKVTEDRPKWNAEAWNAELNACKAVLGTLEAFRDIKSPEQTAKDLMEGINKGLTGENLLQFARRSLEPNKPESGDQT
jgi:hypothetical protein